MQIYQLSSFKKLFYILIVVGFTQGLFASSCDTRTFNIKMSSQVSAYEILNQLSSECGYSMIAHDSVANDRLNEKLFGINIHKMKLKDIFSLLVSSKGLQYSYRNNILKISGLITRTFKIDYVNTERSGSSNTDVSLNGDSNPSTGGSDSAQEGESSGEGSQTTGASIISSDNFSFWSTIQKELEAVINSPLDKFKTPAPIINKEAGLVTVSGTGSQIKRVAAYLDELMERLHRQVMIDVKILSVNLDNSKATGVDWSQLYKLQNVKATYESIKNNGASTIDSETGQITGIDGLGRYANYMRLSGSVTMSDILNFLNTQGDVSSVSNPKITTTNNQPAIFSSGEQLYYKLQQTVSQVSTGGSATGTGDIVKSVFAGVLLDITPQITDNNEIILKINPSISSVKQAVELKDGIRVIPPDLSKKQMSAVVKLQNGQKIILGGLISSKKGTSVKKVPILGNLPIFGNAFKQNISTDIKEELVIIITPYIVTNGIKSVSLKQLGYSDFN